ncbi:MAG: ATP-binding protein, partial [Treponema sp.]|nr:ATP-binding protein [Treponema sp.]
MKINFTAIKDKFFSCKIKSAECVPLKDMGLMDHLEKIVTLSQKYGIDKCQNKGKIHFDYTTKKLGINNIQAILFSHFMEMSNDSRIMVSEIAQSIKCSTIRILKYLNDCEELEKKRLIRCSRDGSSISFRVPRDVRDSLRKYNEFRPERRENLSIGRFFSILKKLFEERDTKELSSSTLYIELNDLIKMNMHLEFCKKIMSCNLNWSDLVLLICFCHLAGNNDDNYIGDHDLEFLDDSLDDVDGFDFTINKLELTDSSHNLIKGNYVEFANDGGFKDSEHWKLTDEAKRDLLTELKGKKNFKKNMVLFNNIQYKKMFYNQREAIEVEKLSSLLQEDHFLEIQNRLDDKGMRKGFACLFSGGPGTGKTETAYQIARLTKRNIMAVDISATKSCWYGESEKKIKEIFDNYRHA